MIPKKYKNKVIGGVPHWLLRTSPACWAYSIINKKYDRISQIKLLDIGCAHGREVRAYFNKGISHVHGVDINEDYINIAKRANPELKFTIADISSLPFEDSEFDVVTCTNTLLYTEVLNGIKEIKRLVNSCGIFIITINQKITDVNENKIIHKVDIKNVLKNINYDRILYKKYCERKDNIPFEHIHEYFRIAAKGR